MNISYALGVYEEKATPAIENIGLSATEAAT
jgi:hypothetical protein